MDYLALGCYFHSKYQLSSFSTVEVVQLLLTSLSTLPQCASGKVSLGLHLGRPVSHLKSLSLSPNVLLADMYCLFGLSDSPCPLVPTARISLGPYLMVLRKLNQPHFLQPCLFISISFPYPHILKHSNTCNTLLLGNLPDKIWRAASWKIMQNRSPK